MYTIKLSDGTLLENLELNGNNFIAPSAVNDAVFEGNLDTVVIYGTETDIETGEEVEIERTYTNMKLMSNIVREGRSWIVLGEKTEEDFQKERMLALESAMNALLNGEG